MRIRVYDIAKKLGITSREVIAQAKDLGIRGCKVPSTVLDTITAEFLELRIREKRDLEESGTASETAGPVSDPEAELPDFLKVESQIDGSATEEYASPEILVDFAARFAEHLKPSTIVDPVCGAGVLLAAVARAGNPEIIHGVDINPSAIAAASSILGDRAKLVVGNTFSSSEGMQERYDLIVADPPLGARLDQNAVPFPLASSPGLFDNEILVWAASRIGKNGAALVVVRPGFFPVSSIQSNQVLGAVQKTGCCVRAAIHIPGGTRVGTSMASYLLVIGPGEQKEIFIGQLESDPQQQARLLSNLTRGKSKGSPSLGRVCSLSEFHGYDSFVAQENLSRLARECGWQKHPTAAVFPQLEVLRKGRAQALSEDANSLYLKLSIEDRATTRLDELRSGKSQTLDDIVHLKLDPKVADPVFMEHWFNESRVGRMTLEGMRSRGGAFGIRLEALKNSAIYLPSVSEQRQIIDGAAYLEKIRAETKELESALWSGTEPLDNLVERIQSINKEDRYEDWLETLPFPLASILWRHHASGGSYRHRYEVLLHFFEATAAFLATIHMSAVMKDRETWESNGERLKEKLAAQKLSLDRATFGSWKLVTEVLGSACRAMLNDPELEDLWHRLYGTTDRKVIEIISGSNLLHVLQQANKIRNDWQGHSGAIGDDTAKFVHDQLVGLVNQLRGLFGRNWQRFELIQPDFGRLKQGTHHVTCKRLMGTKSAPFEERVYQSTRALDADALFLFDTVNQTGLKLRPFIEVIPSPEKKAVACFIFNRLESEGARWVSYHFEQESEICHPSQDVDDTLAMLK